MLFYNLIALLISLFNQQLVIDSICSCDQLLSKEDCKYTNKQCIWDEIGQACSRIACDSFTTIQECIYFTGCAINNNGICSDFTQCYDYIVNKTNKTYNCLNVSLSCDTPDEGDEISVHCQDNTVASHFIICSEIESSQSCLNNTQQADGSMCDWVNESCVAYDYTHCSAMLTETVCRKNNCTWDSTTCSPPLCSNQPKDNCTVIRGDQLGTYQICQYANDACSDPANLTFLNSSTCLVNSGYTATWNGTNCNFCASESYEYLLLMTVLFLNV